MKLHRLLDLFATFGMVLMLLYLLTPSRALLQVDSVEYAGNEGIIARRLPLGDVTAEWSTEITILGSDLQCSASGRSQYEAENEDGKEKEVSRYPIPLELRPCLTLPTEKAVRFEWRVYVLGVIPLRPTTMQKIIPASVGRAAPAAACPQ